MAKRTSPLLPATERHLSALGERIRLARLRRKLTAASVAERAGMSPMTLRGVERGEAGVTIGAYAAVLQVLGMETDLEGVAQNDVVGRQLQDSRMRATAPSAARKSAPIQPEGRAPAPRVAEPQPAYAGETTSMTTARELANLLVVPPTPSRKR
jgi:transcriptional regulator with XRE-family HTH domain